MGCTYVGHRSASVVGVGGLSSDVACFKARDAGATMCWTSRCCSWRCDECARRMDQDGEGSRGEAKYIYKAWMTTGVLGVSAAETLLFRGAALRSSCLRASSTVQ